MTNLTIYCYPAFVLISYFLNNGLYGWCFNSYISVTTNFYSSNPNIPCLYKTVPYKTVRKNIAKFKKTVPYKTVPKIVQKTVPLIEVIIVLEAYK